MTMRSEFQVHMLNGTGIERATALGEAFSELLTKVEAIVPASRERSLVVTKLQEAAFWAKRGMAVDPANQKGG